MAVEMKYVEMQSPDGAVTTKVSVMDVDGKLAGGWKVVGEVEAHKSNLSKNKVMSNMQAHARQIEVDKAAVEVEELVEIPAPEPKLEPEKVVKPVKAEKVGK